jgi:hypothetical protein
MDDVVSVEESQGLDNLRQDQSEPLELELSFACCLFLSTDLRRFIGLVGS